MPNPGKPGSLGINSRIVIDTAITAAPVVMDVTAAVPDGRYQAGNVIPIEVHFSRAVTVTGTPELALAMGGKSPVLVNYSGGSGTDTLTFDYTVGASQTSAKLDYFSAGALETPAGSTITDTLNQQVASLKLPVPGLAGSLSANSVLVVGNLLLLGQGSSGSLISTAVVLTGPPSVFAGELFTLTAKVTSGYAGLPPGPSEVTFLEGSTVLGTVTASDGNASLQVQFPAGNHELIAVYQGDDIHSASTSEPLAVKVDQLIVTGSKIEVENPAGALALVVQPYGRSARKAFNVAVGPVSVDGPSDIFVAPKAGRRGQVKVINGVTGVVSRSFFAFGRNYSGGVALAAADLSGEGISDIITGRATGGRSTIKVFNSATGQLLLDITAFDHVFHRGLSLSAPI